MKKTIITVIATIVLIAPFENAKGQDFTPSIERFPAVNVFVGANVGLSLWVGRFELLLPQVGYGLRLFEEKFVRTTTSWWNGELYTFVDTTFISQRLAGMIDIRGGVVPLGLGFRISDRDIIRLGFKARGRSFRAWDLEHIVDQMILSGGFLGGFLEYVHRRNLSERTSLDLSLDLSLSLFGEYGGNQLFGNIGVGIGGRWNYEIIPNLNIGVQLRYAMLFDARTDGVDARTDVVVVRHPMRNSIDFTVGLHYNIQLGRQRQATQRQQQQRGRGDFQRWDNHPARHQRR